MKTEVTKNDDGSTTLYREFDKENATLEVVRMFLGGRRKDDVVSGRIELWPDVDTFIPYQFGGHSVGHVEGVLTGLDAEQKVGGRMWVRSYPEEPWSFEVSDWVSRDVLMNEIRDKAKPAMMTMVVGRIGCTNGHRGAKGTTRSTLGRRRAVLPDERGELAQDLS